MRVTTDQALLCLLDLSAAFDTVRGSAICEVQLKALKTQRVNGVALA